VSFLVIIVVDFVGAVPEAIAVVLVYRPAAIFFVFFIFVRPLAASEPSEIVGIIVLGEPERLSVLVTALHTSSSCVSVFHRVES